MYSVTGRIKSVKQPRGGYVKPGSFQKTSLGGKMLDISDENIHPSLVGLSVDYMTRFMTGSSKEEAFEISGIGASILGKEKLYKSLIRKVKGLDDKSIRSAAKLSGFDCAYRVGPGAYKPVEGINPDDTTTEHIGIMVKRALHFFDLYGPKVLDGLIFEGGYTNTVSAGDGDFITKDTLWDFKVSKRQLNSTQTLQLLMYWRMGLHSIHPEYQDIRFLGIYNPRADIVYRIRVLEIPDEVIKEVEDKIIGY